MILRWTGFILLVGVAILVIGGAQHWFDVPSIITQLMAILAIVTYAMDRLVKKDEDTVFLVFRFKRQDFAYSTPETEDHTDSLPLRADFDIINHGCPVAHIKMVDTAGLRVKFPDGTTVGSGAKIGFSIEPFPKSGNRIHFYLELQAPHKTRKKKFYFYGEKILSA